MELNAQSQDIFLIYKGSFDERVCVSFSFGLECPSLSPLEGKRKERKRKDTKVDIQEQRKRERGMNGTLGK